MTAADQRRSPFAALRQGAAVEGSQQQAGRAKGGYRGSHERRPCRSRADEAAQKSDFYKFGQFATAGSRDEHSSWKVTETNNPARSQQLPENALFLEAPSLRQNSSRVRGIAGERNRRLAAVGISSS
jgi:hypothetical protein